MVGRRTVALGAGLRLVLRTVGVTRGGPLAATAVAAAGSDDRGWLLLCASFPPFNWWWAAVVAFALLAWVLARPATTPTGGLGYGFLFGLAFYLPLLPWISTLVGAMPWLALAAMCGVFPSGVRPARRRGAAAAGLADLVRRAVGGPGMG